MPGSPANKKEPIASSIADYAAGNNSAGDLIYKYLASHIRTSVELFFGEDNINIDDIIHETIISVLEYIRLNNGFEGDLIGFSIAVARNDCRNIYKLNNKNPSQSIDSVHEWLAAAGDNQLEAIITEETNTVLQKALNRIGRICKKILSGFYTDNKTVEQLKTELEFKDTQSVYYKKQVCLGKILSELQKK
ncbi:MAG: sigma-70 family RNA polymerase sigma factor [bacterium]|nr:sigma-70 family RNA polymerase sigma factor [bacterium]MCP4800734.1 sigma-70 family RNA polymerase sigma factor [bacterium]